MWPSLTLGQSPRSAALRVLIREKCIKWQLSQDSPQTGVPGRWRRERRRRQRRRPAGSWSGAAGGGRSHRNAARTQTDTSTQTNKQTGEKRSRGCKHIQTFDGSLKQSCSVCCCSFAGKKKNKRLPKSHRITCWPRMYNAQLCS